MLRIITLILTILSVIVKAIRPKKSAAEQLKEPSPTAEAVADAERKAEEKFGPRPNP
jgi:hypothetical protein